MAMSWFRSGHGGVLRFIHPGMYIAPATLFGSAHVLNIFRTCERFEYEHICCACLAQVNKRTELALLYSFYIYIYIYIYI